MHSQLSLCVLPFLMIVDVNLRLDIAYIVTRCFAFGRIHGQYHERKKDSANGEKYEKVSGGMLRSNGTYFRFHVIEILFNRGEPRKLTKDKVLRHTKLQA